MKRTTADFSVLNFKIYSNFQLTSIDLYGISFISQIRQLEKKINISNDQLMCKYASLSWKMYTRGL
jgi:hypothetical protein